MVLACLNALSHRQDSCGFRISLESDSAVLQSFPFFQKFWAIFVFLCFQMTQQVLPKKAIGSLIGIVLNLCASLGKDFCPNLTEFSGHSLCLCVFVSDLSVIHMRSFTHSVGFILMHFIFGADLNRFFKNILFILEREHKLWGGKREMENL